MSKVVIITGASSGIGELSAKALARTGAFTAGTNHFPNSGRPVAQATVAAVADRVRVELLERIGLGDLLHPAGV